MKKVFMVILMLLVIALIGCGKSVAEKKAMLADSQKVYSSCCWSCAMKHGTFMVMGDPCGCEAQRAERDIMIKGM